MVNYRVISSDDHIYEPPDLWTSRAEPKFKDCMPHIERLEDGDWWFCDGLKIMGTASGSQAGVRFEDQSKLAHTTVVEELRPGGWVPEARMTDMDEDGVDVSFIYPTVGCPLYGVPDSDLLTEIFRIYNDFAAEHCRAFPDRLRGIAMINVDNVKSGVQELERCADMGMAGGMITVYPLPGRGYNLPEYDLLWAASQDLGMPLALHVNTIRGDDFLKHGARGPLFVATGDHWVRMSLGQIILSGVFQRFPKLQIGSVEQDLSWIPYFLDRLDYSYTQMPREGWWDQYTGDKLPSEYFHSNVFLSFQEDGLGIEMRDLIGVDSLMWGSDYPHIEGTFPKSREILEEILVDCTEEEKAKIAGGNAARVYNLN